MTTKWYLGFDCATKTFAFSLGRIDLAAARERTPVLKAKLHGITELIRRGQTLESAAKRALLHDLAPVVAALDEETRSFLVIADGATVDLFPGRPDKEISTVERLRAVSHYVRDRVRPAIAAHKPAGEPLRVVVEFQMGHNAPSRAVAAALVALFADEDIIIVGPSLKNSVAVSEEGQFCYFAERYSATYSANKAHAKYNFEQLEQAFGTGIPPTHPASLRGHIADSFMQIVGFLARGPDKNAETMF